MKELQDENRGLLEREQESLISRQLAEQERDKAKQALDAAVMDADRQMAEMLAKMGAESDQAAQHLATLQAEKEEVANECEAAIENAGELQTRMDEIESELAAARASQGGASRVLELESDLGAERAAREQAEAAKTELEGKVRAALTTAQQQIHQLLRKQRLLLSTSTVRRMSRPSTFRSLR